MRTEEKTITYTEYILDEEEMKRLGELNHKLKTLYFEKKITPGDIEEISDEIEAILEGTWSAPLPF